MSELIKGQYNNMLAATVDASVNEILANCLEGKCISKADAYQLINSPDTPPIVSVANCIRDRVKPGPVTYSRKVFINLVNLCRDTCSYCTYKKDPGQDGISMMQPNQALSVAQAGKKGRCTEALIVTGERPEMKHEEARGWLKLVGHSTTIDYIGEVSDLILRKTGLLPHTNAGCLTKKEILLLKDTNVSLGLMLESSSERLLQKDMPHERAPSKNPKTRIKTLTNAGELKVPTTTGLLVGIGETPEELIDSLFVIKGIHKKFGHIQEVIMQNFSPKQGTKMAQFGTPPYGYFLKSVAIARLLMQDMNIQVPPNLNPNIFGTFIDAGINDWGGISPITMDYVNPEYRWPNIELLKSVTIKKGYDFRARLPIYPEFLDRSLCFVQERLRGYIDSIADDSGLVKEAYLG
jgi:FO synthase subunit 1